MKKYTLHDFLTHPSVEKIPMINVYKKLANIRDTFILEFGTPITDKNCHDKIKVKNNFYTLSEFNKQDLDDKLKNFFVDCLKQEDIVSKNTYNFKLSHLITDIEKMLTTYFLKNINPKTDDITDIFWENIRNNKEFFALILKDVIEEEIIQNEIKKKTNVAYLLGKKANIALKIGSSYYKNIMHNIFIILVKDKYIFDETKFNIIFCALYDLFLLKKDQTEILLLEKIFKIFSNNNLSLLDSNPTHVMLLVYEIILYGFSLFKAVKDSDNKLMFCHYKINTLDLLKLKVWFKDKQKNNLMKFGCFALDLLLIYKILDQNDPLSNESLSDDLLDNDLMIDKLLFNNSLLDKEITENLKINPKPIKQGIKSTFYVYLSKQYALTWLINTSYMLPDLTLMSPKPTSIIYEKKTDYIYVKIHQNTNLIHGKDHMHTELLDPNLQEIKKIALSVDENYLDNYITTILFPCIIDNNASEKNLFMYSLYQLEDSNFDPEYKEPLKNFAVDFTDYVGKDLEKKIRKIKKEKPFIWAQFNKIRNHKLIFIKCLCLYLLYSPFDVIYNSYFYCARFRLFYLGIPFNIQSYKFVDGFVKMIEKPLNDTDYTKKINNIFSYIKNTLKLYKLEPFIKFTTLADYKIILKNLILDFILSFLTVNLDEFKKNIWDKDVDFLTLFKYISTYIKKPKYIHRIVSLIFLEKNSQSYNTKNLVDRYAFDFVNSAYQNFALFTKEKSFATMTNLVGYDTKDMYLQCAADLKITLETCANIYKKISKLKEHNLFRLRFIRKRENNNLISSLIIQNQINYFNSLSVEKRQELENIITFPKDYIGLTKNFDNTNIEKKITELFNYIHFISIINSYDGLEKFLYKRELFKKPVMVLLYGGSYKGRTDEMIKFFSNLNLEKKFITSYDVKFISQYLSTYFQNYTINKLPHIDLLKTILKKLLHYKPKTPQYHLNKQEEDDILVFLNNIDIFKNVNILQDDLKKDFNKIQNKFFDHINFLKEAILNLKKARKLKKCGLVLKFKHIIFTFYPVKQDKSSFKVKISNNLNKKSYYIKYRATKKINWDFDDIDLPLNLYKLLRAARPHLVHISDGTILITFGTICKILDLIKATIHDSVSIGKYCFPFLRDILRICLLKHYDNFDFNILEVMIKNYCDVFDVDFPKDLYEFFNIPSFEKFTQEEMTNPNFVTYG